MHEYLRCYIPFALYTVRTDGRHALKPIYRELMYRELDKHPQQTQLVRSYGDLAAAERSSLVWQAERPGDEMSVQLLRAMRSTLAGTLRPDALDHETEAVSAWLQDQYADGAGIILMLALLAGEIYLGHQVLAIVGRLLE